jgi:hypothetical protein
MNNGLMAAIVSGGFGIVIALIGLLAKANKREHGENSTKLDRVLEATLHLKDGQTRVESKIDGHINDHAKGDV